MPDLAWYIRRASAMPPQELLHRALFVQQKWRWKRSLAKRRPARPPRDPIANAAPIITESARNHATAEKLVREADLYLDRRWLFFEAEGIEEETIDWHRDPLSGVSAPRTFGFDINHRDERIVGNIKNTWEKNRHHHLTVLAAAFAMTGEEKYADETHRQLTSWVAENPFLIGVNWTHPLEQGIRLIAWIWCERLLRGSTRHEDLFGVKGVLWESIFHHQDFIVRTYSRESSANNHLIGEMAGLYAASSAWPYFLESSRWRSLAHRVLENEIVAQTFPSGLNREMAFSYHLFTLEFFLVALDEARRSKNEFSEQFRDGVRRMVEALPAVTDYGGNLPRYGDGDEGMALQLQSRYVPRHTWLLTLGSELTGARVKAPTPPPLTAVLMGYSATGCPEGESDAGTTAFTDAGIYVLTSRRNTKGEVFVIADAGPHGFLSIAAHAHADALSFTLSAAGIPFLVDPGTYAYHTKPQWRNYFRGTRAHNTVTVDQRDQSESAGSFLWTRMANTVVESWSDDGQLCALTAHHDGFSDLGITHRRSFELQDNLLQVTDEIDGPGRHEIAGYFHFAPECEVTVREPGLVSARRAGVTLDLTFSSIFDIDVALGAPDAGWYSPVFGVREPGNTVRGRALCRLPVTWATMIAVHHEG